MPDLPAPKASDRILAVAGELFYRQGTRAVGVDEIAARAGATKPTLYRAFASKDQLIAAFLEGQAQALWARFEAAAARFPDDPRAQLAAVFAALAGQVEAPDFRGCALSNAAVEHPDAAHPGRQVTVAQKAALRERLRAMTKAMGARRPKKLADGLLLLLEGAWVSHQIFGPEGPAAAAGHAAETLIEAHMKGHD
ncbi:MAG: TetR/AcrR family transcriptional regulator [Phenylobacterium sp.]|uniref:TetR/AcrR family transcriptional regulator n=1 Tax=Phenylobacterium sp. TaxID=1871053 RepID=UPI001A4C25E7|nr:TetR/AcrR family transcriptional regulator [Phenylobacterium sp.]MBL8774153.1 TetR/AcrR family transcriptional regulator [Phenylobacterium sp.]